MANRFPLVIDTTDGNKLKELPAGDNLDLRESSIVRVQDVDALGTINAADITVNGNRLVAQTFIDLTDTPENYADAADKFVKVNAEGTGVEFRPFSDIGNIEVEEIEVGTRIVPATAGTVDIGTGPLYFNRVTANEFMGDILTADESRVFNAATGKITYAALEGQPTTLSEFENDIGYLLTEDLDARIAGLFDEGRSFETDIVGSVFGDDSSMIVDGIASEVVGVVNNTTITTVNLTAITATADTSIANEYIGPSGANNVINAQNNYDVVIGESNTNATIIHNAQADDFQFESGIGLAELSGSSDLLISAGNRIRFVGTPVRFSTYTDSEAGLVVAVNGDVIYNTDQNRFQFYQNGAWIDLHKGLFDGNVSSTAGESNFNDVVIAGNLTVEGTTTTVDTENTTISDNVIVLNNGEVGAGITNTTAGIEIDRGSAANVTFVYDDSVDKWTLGAETLVADTFEGNLSGDVAGNVNGNITSTGTSSLAIVTISGNTTATGTITSNAGFIGNITGNLDGDVTGSIFADDSTILVDGTNGKIVAPVEADVTGNVTGDVTGNVTGNVSGDVTGDLTGNVTGNLTGDVKGSVFGEDSTPIVDATDNTLNGDLTGNVTGNVTGNIDATSLTVGANDATTISIGNGSSTTTIEGTIQFTNALIANNLTADDSISITTDGNTSGEAISIGPGGSNTFINLTATNIRFFGNITNNIAATAGITGDLKGSVVADDSTILVDAVNGVIPKANIEGATNWDTAYSWGDHSTQGYLQDGGSFQGDVKGSVFADDSSVMVNSVDFTMSSDLLNLTPLNAEPDNPIGGMLAVADGSGWNPTGTGTETLVIYLNSAWRQVAAGV